MVAITIYEIVDYLISLVIMLLIVQFVMSLLISFNVVNMHNQFVASIWRALNVLLDPLLNPLRRILPNTGMIDFSPMALFILLTILRIVVRNLAVGSVV